MVDMEKEALYRGVLLQPRDHQLWVATEEAGVLPVRGCHATHMDKLIEGDHSWCMMLSASLLGGQGETTTL